MKLFKRKKKAFSLIELLVVIAILGILFITLVSKVDFALDKAKTAGVQVLMHNYQTALTMTSNEVGGFNKFGWDTGDLNGNRCRDSFDEGDIGEGGFGTPGYQDGIKNYDEVWTGHKVYSEEWTDIWTLTNPADPSDTSAYTTMQDYINSYLKPDQRIIINPETGEINMMEGGKDTWGNEFHGWYFSSNDGTDGGAIIIYSDGPNSRNGSEHSIVNGTVTIAVPGNNIKGKDDLSVCVYYTYARGFGQTQVKTSGFSVNQ
jgi:prepilin-type N-terminal cleavage/methylation domain-containing protein